MHAGWAAGSLSPSCCVPAGAICPQHGARQYPSTPYRNPSLPAGASACTPLLPAMLLDAAALSPSSALDDPVSAAVSSELQARCYLIEYSRFQLHL